ncbi:MAG TPA: cation diffusion facilitator family transporter [Terrimicrobiaceae bacterium]
MDSVARRAGESRKLLLAGVLANLVLAFIKVAGGFLGHSNALIADGIESALDVLSSLMMWGAFKYAERPPDSDHPYGHGKMESLAAVCGSLLLIIAGVAVGLHSIREIFFALQSTDARAAPAGFTLIVLALTIILKEGLFRWVRSQSARIESRALQTDALHHRSDAFTSLAAAVGISATLIGGPRWTQADSWAALFSCAVIIFNGFGMLRASIGEVLDEQAAPDLVTEILAAVRAVPGVTSVEKCRVRKSGLMRFADIHVRVAGECTVREGHHIAHLVKNSLMEGHFHLADVVIHIEPETGEGAMSSEV